MGYSPFDSMVLCHEFVDENEYICFAHYEIVREVPENPDPNVIYLVSQVVYNR